jgi:malonyl-CoA O-methyltransferase
MSEFHVDHAQVRRHFGRAARSYEHHDALQREVQQTLFGRLDFYLEEPALVADVGAGPGRGTAQLKKRWPKARVIALDAALPMLREAKRHSAWLKPFQRVCADATRLPLPDH